MLKEVVYRDELVNTFVEAHIADIHMGATVPKLQFDILKEQFIDYLEQLPILDIISIDGDIFDHKFMANSNAVMYACEFIELLIGICRKKNTTLIIIAGTALHDADQLKLFYHYREQADIRIVEQAQFEFIKGKNVLIIPELYNMGSDYYNKFLRNGSYYDACYMHGTFKGSIYGKDIADLNSDREPVFSIEDFAYCKGPIISGHVHTSGCFNKHFYYCGSPYRWKFGEEEDKGFFILLHNIKTMKYCMHFEPITSFRYDTINLDYMLQSDPQKIIEEIRARREQGIEYIRVQFTKNNENTLAVVRSYFRNNPNVRIDANFKNDSVIKETSKLNDEYKEYGFVFDKSATPYEILAKYINHKENSTFITSQDLIALLEETL